MKGVIVHAVLATLGLLLAWVVWTAPASEADSPDTVEVLDCTPASVRAVYLKEKDRDVKLVPEGQGDHRAFWITVDEHPQRGKAKHTEFAGSKDVTAFLKSIAPLRATRSLGQLRSSELTELGLRGSPAPSQLTLTCGGHTTKLLVGGTAYGSGARYMRAASGGPVFLMPGEIFSKLEGAEFHLMQRELQSFDLKDVQTLVVRAQGHERKLLHRDRLDARQAQWVDATTPDQRNELFGNWLDLVGRLRVIHYLGPHAQPGSDLPSVSAAPTPVLTLKYQDADGKALGSLELVRVDGQTPMYYARTMATHSWVQVPASVGQRVERDVGPVVGLDAANGGASTPGATGSGTTTATSTGTGGAGTTAPPPAPASSPAAHHP